MKVVLGFISRLGMKSSVADQPYHWGLLDREIHLGRMDRDLLAGLYLLENQIAHDSDMPTGVGGRLALAIITSFVVYLIPGMCALKDFRATCRPAYAGLRHRQVGPARQHRRPHADRRRQETCYRLPAPARTRRILRPAPPYAAKVDKPLFIDSPTGHGCVNCREMEARDLSDPQVLYPAPITDRGAFYSDDKKVLPESEWVTTDSGKCPKVRQDQLYYALKPTASTPSPTTPPQAATETSARIRLNVENFVQSCSGVEAYKKQQ